MLAIEDSFRDARSLPRYSLFQLPPFFDELCCIAKTHRDGTAQFGPMSRPMTSAETDALEKKFGYSGIGYKTDGVRAVPLAINAGRECYEPSAEATYSGEYPIARYLYVYFNKKPNEPLDPLRAEFVKYILSRDGQAQTGRGGYYPITNEVRQNELKRVGLSSLGG